MVNTSRLIFTPEDLPLVVDAEQACHDGAPAVLSVLCHRRDRDIDIAFPALVEMLQTLSLGKANTYHDIIAMGLPAVARERWEAFMRTNTSPEFRSQLLGEAAAQGKAEGLAEGKAQGLAEGKAQDVLTVLKIRGVRVPTADATGFAPAPISTSSRPGSAAPPPPPPSTRS